MNKKLRKLLRDPKLFIKDFFRKHFTRPGKKGPPASTGKGVPAKYSLDEAMQLLKSFEENYPVTQIFLGNTPCWHILRYGIWMKLWKMTQSRRSHANFNVYNIDISASWRAHYADNPGAIPAHETGRYDYLLFTNPNSSDRIILKHATYQRIIDPVYEALSKTGTAAKVIALRNPSPMADDRYVHAPVYILPGALQKTGYFHNLNVPNDFFEKICAHFRAADLTRQHICSLIDAYVNLKNYYAEILAAAKPRAIFFLNLGIHMPLCEAAKELGITCTEIQHGVQKANTPIYNDWMNFPRQGYSGLPDYFGVWGAVDAAHISRTFKGTVKPLICGYPWLTKPESRSLTSEAQAAINHLRERFDFLGVFTLQNQTSMPEEIVDLAKHMKNAALIIRKHPKWSKGFKSAVFFGENIIFDDNLHNTSILSLLEQIDFHITRDSTSAHEANYAGIPTFIYSDEGRRMFEDEIKDNIVLELKQLKALGSAREEILAFLKDYKENRAKKMISDVDLRDALDVFVQ